MSIGSILAERRQELGLLQADLVELLARDGVRVKKATISHWENDRVLPNAAQFIALCHALEIHDVPDVFMGVHGSIFSGLNRTGRERLREYARFLHADEAFRLAEPEPRRTRMLPLYDLAVSAGTGQLLDGENYEMVECGIEVPEGANFGVRIAGNSMEPRYHDGQTIWVRQQRSLMFGEIGIFLYDGEAYLKKLVGEDGKTKLRSLNPDYQDIIVSDTLPFRALGKVLS